MRIELKPGEPAIPMVFARGLWTALQRRLPGRAAVGEALAAGESLEVAVQGVRLDGRLIRRYRALCGSSDTAGLLASAALPEVLFLRPMSALILSEGFPASPLGLIHVEQDLELLVPLAADAFVDLYCSLASVQTTERGTEIRMRLELYTKGELAWTGGVMFLARGKAGGAGRTAEQFKPWVESPRRTWSLDARADAGVAYARVADDWNPHHLWALTARPMGFQRPIAHGMWTLAWSLEQLGGADQPLAVQVRFKKPLFLPGSAQLRADGDGTQGREGGMRFAVVGGGLDGGVDPARPVLTGTLRRL